MIGDRWMECFGGDVNRMVCGGVWVVDGGWIDWGLDRVGLSLVGLGWAIVCGVCYYRNLLQMQQLRPNPRPRLDITNSADNTH